jgi:hypothetical protein
MRKSTARLMPLMIVPVFAVPRPVHIRMALGIQHGLVPSGRVTQALERGLYADSLIARPPAGEKPWSWRDSVPPGQRPAPIFILQCRIAAVDSTTFAVGLALRNVLAQFVVPADSFQVTATQLDSALEANGRRYAQALSSLIARRR